MANNRTSKDLFGKPIRRRRPKLEATLERIDRRTLAERAARARWVRRTVPKYTSFVTPIQTYFVLREVTSSFIYGNYVAVIVLATSFVEHWFAANLGGRGYQKEASRGLAASISVARAQGLVDDWVLDKADQLRMIRNPFAHLKSSGHEYNLDRRSLRMGADPESVLENDAKDAIIAMYAVALYAFSRHARILGACSD